MDELSLLGRGVRLQPVMIALVVGVNAALPMYLWHSVPEVAMTTFVVAGYTAWLWAATRTSPGRSAARGDLRTLRQNRTRRRLARMLSDVGFWWALVFGCASVTGSVWYAGLHDPPLLVAIGAAWAVTAALLNFEGTLMRPSARCRRCSYDLGAHLDPEDPRQHVRCPECGARWSKGDLCLVPPASGAPRRAA